MKSDLDLFTEAVDRVHSNKMRVLVATETEHDHELFKIEGSVNDNTLRLVYRPGAEASFAPAVFYEMTETRLKILRDFLISITERRMRAEP